MTHVFPAKLYKKSTRHFATLTKFKKKKLCLLRKAKVFRVFFLDMSYMYMYMHTMIR